MNKLLLSSAVSALLMAAPVLAGDHSHDKGHGAVADKVIAEQRAMLAKDTEGKGFGPQAPRDIDSKDGHNTLDFGAAPAFSEMNLCNIHFHKNAEHKGGEFTTYAGNGDGHGYQSGYKYSGELSKTELAEVDHEICPSKHGSLHPGDTIEVHYVHSTAKINPGPTLGACLSESIKNPQLRVEAQVYALVNDPKALDFADLSRVGMTNGFHQATGIPGHTGTPVHYDGSTTGPQSSRLPRMKRCVRRRAAGSTSRSTGTRAPPSAVV